MSWISNGSLLASANRVPTTLARGRGMPPRFYLRLHPRSISTISSSSSSPFVDDLASTGVIESTLPSTNAVTTLFEPLSTLFLSFPPFLGLSYALCIPLFSLSLRLATSVPIQLWQRKRTQRFAEIVVPQTKIAQELAASELRDASRRAGKSYEEYQIAFRARVSSIELSAMGSGFHHV
jgi:inner membrane protein COX18